MSQLVAVFDIGKTNKKIALYDANLTQVAFRQESFPATISGDGLLHEQIEPMWTWFITALRDLYAEHPFEAISITTHGATIVSLDANGDLALPPVAYDHGLSDDEQTALDAAFYDLVGDARALQDETGTCDLPLLINPAKALLFHQQRHGEGFARIARILNFPQYWGWRLTGQMASEPTYTFNHSFLHDIRSQQPSSAATALGVADALDSTFAKPWDTLGTLHAALQQDLGLPALPVTVGIHDSNAALLPYLAKYQDRDFVVNSTGTWCVAMHGVDGVSWDAGELGLKVIFNIDALGAYRKVSFLMGGQDYELYHGLIGGEHGDFDAARLDAVLGDASRAIVPGAFPSQFHEVRGGAKDGGRWYSVAELEAGERPDWFADQQFAHDLLNISLALQTKVALDHVDVAEDTVIFVEGGFRSNATYLALLAALYGQGRVICTSLEQATATGAALLGHCLLQDKEPAAFAEGLAITETPVAVPELGNLAAYAEAFFATMR